MAIRRRSRWLYRLSGRMMQLLASVLVHCLDHGEQRHVIAMGSWRKISRGSRVILFHNIVHSQITPPADYTCKADFCPDHIKRGLAALMMGASSCVNKR
jgi:hypothetical protein